jgi:pyruvate carboxylase subunit B
MSKKIKFCLLYRDMWQSSGKYVPRVAQLNKVAQPIIDMGCFARVETNGGGFEQINLLFGENPNKAVREWTQPFNDAGIQTQMLERALNGIRMNPVPADVRRLMFRVKKAQGTDISRSFDGLNDVRNLENSIKFANEEGMVSQAALSVTESEVHTVTYYIDLADQLIKLGAQEICIKDMAGIGRPVSLGKIVSGIKETHPDTLIQYHGHSGPGFSVASILEVARAGADIIDVAMEPLSWGTGHADLLTVHAMLKDAGFEVPDINMKAYMEVRSLTQSFIDDFLGYYINPKNRHMNSLLIGPGLPGGMMGSLMADLENNLKSLNKWMTKRDKPTFSQDDLLIKLFEEVEYIWPKMGYPPLVTPYSQYVKNVALMNVMQVLKGKERWSMIDDNTWDLLIGRSGELPGSLSDELVQMATKHGKEFYTGVPQDLYPDALDEIKVDMLSQGWELGEDNEELMEYAMHPEQYKAFKSGKAKEHFEADFATKKEAAHASNVSVVKTAITPVLTQPSTMNIDVNGEKFLVQISYGDEPKASANNGKISKTKTETTAINGSFEEIIAPLEGNFMLTKNTGDKAIKVGDKVNIGDIIGYIEAMKVYNAIAADKAGTIVEVCPSDGSPIEEDDVIVKLN